MNTMSRAAGDPSIFREPGAQQELAVRIPRYLDVSVLQNSAEPDIAVALVSDLAGLAMLETDWRALETEAAGSIHAFQTYDWCAAWAKTYCQEGGCYQLNVVTVRDRGRLVLVWPLMRTCTGPFCVLRWLSDPYCQYGDVLAAQDGDTDSWLASAWDAILSQPGIDTLRLRHVRADAAIHGFLADNSRPAGETQAAPYLDLRDYPNEVSYNKRYSKVQRRRRRRIKAELQKRGDLNFAIYQNGEWFNSLTDRIIEKKRSWLRGRGLFSKALACGSITDFIKALADESKGGLKVVTSVLKAGSSEVSYEIGLRYAGRHLAFITAHDTDLTNASPARLHMDLSQRQAIRDHMLVFDLMVPANSHKVSWSNNSVEVHDFYHAVSRRGWLYGKLYLELCRPVIRRIYQATPRKLRKRVTGLIER